MRFPVLKLVADFHNADSALCLCDIVFALLWRIVGENLRKLFRRDKIDVIRKDFLDVIILDCHKFLGVFQALVYVSYGFL